MIIFTLSYGTVVFIAMALVLCTVVTWHIIVSVIHKKKQIETENLFLLQKEKELSLEFINKEQINESLRQKLEYLEKDIQSKSWEEKESKKILLDKVSALSNAQKQFELEKERIEQESKEQSRKNEDEKYRQWNEHEQHVISMLKNACENPSNRFISYDNMNLPSVFENTIKPDFCIRFNNRYIIFDAKKSKNIKSYLLEQAKNTAEKYKDYTEISKIIFFVVSEECIKSVNTPMIAMNGWNFLIIPPSSISGILFLLKKMETLEELSDINPEERENILSTIMDYKQHISVQNSVNILLTEHSFSLTQNEKNLPIDIQQSLKKQDTPPLPFSLQKAKNLSHNISEQQQRIQKMKTPQIQI